MKKLMGLWVCLGRVLTHKLRSFLTMLGCCRGCRGHYPDAVGKAAPNQLFQVFQPGAIHYCKPGSTQQQGGIRTAFAAPVRSLWKMPKRCHNVNNITLSLLLQYQGRHCRQSELARYSNGVTPDTKQVNVSRCRSDFISAMTMTVKRVCSDWSECTGALFLTQMQ